MQQNSLETTNTTSIDHSLGTVYSLKVIIYLIPRRGHLS